MAGNVRPNTLQRPGGAGFASPAGAQTLSPSVASTSTDFASAVRKVMPPNKKQHDTDLKDIADRIASKEREIVARKQQFVAGSSTHSERRNALPTEITAANDRLKVASEAIKNRNDEIKKKHDEVNQLRSRMTYRSEAQIDDTINKLEYKRTHHNFSLPEEQKIIREIDKLRRSKNELRSFNKLDGDRKHLETSLKELRDSRQACFFGVQRLISEDKSLRDTERRHRDGLDEIGREIQELVNRRHHLMRDHENRVAEWEAHVAANRRFKHVVEMQLRNNARNAENATNELVIRDPYAGAKQVISSLLTYLQQHVKPEDQTGALLLPPTVDASSPQARSSSPPPPSTPGDDGTPGYFLPKKYSDATTPTRGGGGGHGRVKKDKKKTKPIAHSAAVVAQFTSLDLLPPANTAEVPAAIESLKAKKCGLDLKTAAALASLTPKISPTDEELPPLHQAPPPNPAPQSSPPSHQEPPENLPSITVSASDETDSRPPRPTSAVPSLTPLTPLSSSDEPLLPLTDDSIAPGPPQITCEVTTSLALAQDPIPLLTHSYTIDSVSEEDFSATTSLGGESTAENSGDEEDRPITLKTPAPALNVVLQENLLLKMEPKTQLTVRLDGGGDGRHLRPDAGMAFTMAFPETPPIDEAFTKPIFSPADLTEEA